MSKVEPNIQSRTKAKVNQKVISVASFFVGFALVALIDVFDRKTEIEEHGLIPGFHKASCVLDKGEEGQLYNRLIQGWEGREHTKQVLDEAVAEFEHHSIENDGVVGMYAVVPSGRGDNREAISVLVETDWRNPSLISLFVSLNLMRFLGGIESEYKTAPFLDKSTIRWLSRDILFIFIDASRNPYGSAIRKFLQDYHDGAIPITRRGSSFAGSQTPNREHCNREHFH